MATKNNKVLPVTTPAKHAEEILRNQFQDTESEMKVSGDAPQLFNRVRDIVAIPGFGVQIVLHPTPADPTTERNISYYQALEICKGMRAMLSKAQLADTSAVAEMFTKFERKLLEAVESDLS
jgi:hypothetical protein